MSAGLPFLLLINPSAAGGRAERRLPEAERVLGERGVVHRTLLTESIEHARAQAREAIERGEGVAVMSGDGLIGQVGGVLAGSETPLGILPGGRGNDLARVVGIPKDLRAAAEILAAGRTRTIDVGEVNGHRFLGIASCGFDSECNRIANDVKLVRGNLVYLYSVPRALAAWRPAAFEVSVDGETHSFEGYSVAVANNRAYGGGMYIAPDAELDDGKLDVVLTAQVGKLRFLANLPKVFKGAHLDSPEVTVVRGKEVEIRADRSFAVYADGDAVTELPARIRLLPRALKLLAPPE